jgi:hypothetical protein
MTNGEGPGRRSRRVTTRFSAAEAEDLDELCTRYGLRPSGVLRAGVDSLRGRAPKLSGNTGASAEVVRLRMELNRLGNNVNQSVRKLHREGVDDEVVNTLLSTMAQIDERVEMVMRGHP